MNTIKINPDGIEVRLSAFVFLDTNHPDKDVWVAYCPELDLTGYDHGEEAAKKSLEFVLKDYFDFTVEHGTLEADLLAHGWHKYKNGRLVEPTYKDMMRKGKLDNVFALQSFTKYSIPVTV